MSNMSYCRMRNTLADLRDCYDHWRDVDRDENPEEWVARQRLYRLCQQIVDDFNEEV